jgi:chorismate mutase / prephenate dehydratase
MLELTLLRDKIEGIDTRLLALLAERQSVVLDIVSAKLNNASPIRDHEREEALLLKLRQQASGLGLDPGHIERMYRVIMDMSVAHQEAAIRSRADTPLRVAYQGVEGSYSHLAAQRRYAGRPSGAALTGYASFAAAAQAVETGVADLGLLPIENTTAGSINETYDILSNGKLHIRGEVVSMIEHCLLALPGATIDQVKIVMSHPQALAQCHLFLAQHPHLQSRQEFDTAGAARKVAESGDRTQSAIASASAAQRYGLQILAHGIQSVVGNATRFVEIGLHPIVVASDLTAKTSLMFVLAERPGALSDILVQFAQRGITLTKLESRPIPESPFTYRFYADIIANTEYGVGAVALDAVRASTSQLLVLGTYAV